MPSANSVIRVIAAPVVLAIIVFVSWVGTKLMDSISTGLSGPPASLGWPSLGSQYFFMALGLIGLSIVVFVWLITARVREDTRQELQPRGPF